MLRERGSLRHVVGGGVVKAGALCVLGNILPLSWESHITDHEGEEQQQWQLSPRWKMELSSCHSGS